jgi:RNA polymerase sigma factor (sigma-70 family)
VSNIVRLVDDDSNVRRALTRLLRAMGYAVESFPSAVEFLHHPPDENPSCLLLDLRIPDVSGLELLEVLHTRPVLPAVVFISGHEDIDATVKAMKLGAVDFLLKPLDEKRLIASVNHALARSEQHHRLRHTQEEAEATYRSLSARQREVAVLVCKGYLNKQIASELGISEKTVKVHRGRAMIKLRVRSVPALVRFLDALSSEAHVGQS